MTIDRDEERGLYDEIIDGNVERVRELISMDMSLIHQATVLGSCLHSATTFGQLSIVEELVCLGVCPLTSGRLEIKMKLR